VSFKRTFSLLKILPSDLQNGLFFSSNNDENINKTLEIVRLFYRVVERYLSRKPIGPDAVDLRSGILIFPGRFGGGGTAAPSAPTHKYAPDQRTARRSSGLQPRRCGGGPRRSRGLTQHFDHAARGPRVRGAQAPGVPAMSGTGGPGRVALGLVQFEPDEYVQDHDERPRGQEEQYRRQLERVRQLVGQTAGGQLRHVGPVRELRVHQSHLNGLENENKISTRYRRSSVF